MESLSGLLTKSKKIDAKTTIQTHYDGISDLSLNQQNRNHLAASSFDKTISIYDMTTEKEINVLKGHEKGVWTVSYQPTSNQLISGGNDTNAILWDTTSGKQITKLNIHNKSIYDVQFSNSGDKIATCSKDCICIWDVKNLNKPLDCIKENKEQFKDFIYCLNFLQDEDKIITGFIDGTLIIHTIGNNLENDKSIVVPSKTKLGENPEDVYNRSVFSIEPLHKNKNLFLLSHSDGSVRLYEYKNERLKLKDQYYYFTAAVTCARTNDDDTKIIASSKDRTAELWTYGKHDKIDYTISWHKNIVSSAVFVTNDKIATSSFDNTVKIWDLRDGANSFGDEL